jgi:hypothetical protein
MSKKQNQVADTSSSEMAYMLFYLAFILVKYIIGAFLLIWSVNTLFACDIPYALKTVLAGITLLDVFPLIAPITLLMDNCGGTETNKWT